MDTDVDTCITPMDATTEAVEEEVPEAESTMIQMFVSNVNNEDIGPKTVQTTQKQLSRAQKPSESRRKEAEREGHSSATQGHYQEREEKHPHHTHIYTCLLSLKNSLHHSSAMKNSLLTHISCLITQLIIYNKKDNL